MYFCSNEGLNKEQKQSLNKHQQTTGTLDSAVRPSLVPMRDLVHTIDGVRVDSGTGRTGARREDGAWDLGKRR